jgi:hypothetical protein
MKIIRIATLEEKLVIQKENRRYSYVLFRSKSLLYTLIPAIFKTINNNLIRFMKLSEITI